MGRPTRDDAQADSRYGKPMRTDEERSLLEALGADSTNGSDVEINGWTGRSFLHSTCKHFKFVVIDDGPKSIREAKEMFRHDDEYVILIPKMGVVLLKSGEKSITEIIHDAPDHERIVTAISGSTIKTAKNEVVLGVCLDEIIDNIPKASSDYVSRGMFSAHYLKTRLFNDTWKGTEDLAKEIQRKKTKPSTLFSILGWNTVEIGAHKVNTHVTIIRTAQKDLGLKIGNGVAPSSEAVAALKRTPWCILTNGINWRLYTNKIATVTTDYFQVDYKPDRIGAIRYLVAVFSFNSYGRDPLVEKFLHGSLMYAKKVEENLKNTIADRDGPFFNLVKAVLNYDGKKRYSDEDLEEAKAAALKAMYRIWLVLYAESRELLPVKNRQYALMSLQTIKTKLDFYDKRPEQFDCWMDMSKLFKGMREGSRRHNLPPYNGGIFEKSHLLDNTMLKNEFVAKALRSLVESDNVAIDYAGLGVRNIGSAYEALMEIGIKQADKDIMVHETKNGEVVIVETTEDSKYTYKKGSLYLTTKGGILSRKSLGSYFTPEKFVEFLVRRGLEPLFANREKLMDGDISAYVANKSPENRRRCTNRLLDIKVVDPAMGSGHFLVEALNQITAWATSMLAKYPEHPVWEDIKNDHDVVLKTHCDKGITLKANFLKHEMLLKRRIMKQCIFGVDLNPLAVDLAKFSLWLDSFAIGVPLTYMNHHLKTGDSTIGAWLGDVGNKKNRSLDPWQEETGKARKIMNKVTNNSDITVEQVRHSNTLYKKYEGAILPHKIMLDVVAASQMDKSLMPKNMPDLRNYLERFVADSKACKLESSSLKVRAMAQNMNDIYRFFHWELEFMDVFDEHGGGGEGGKFDLVVGNPPWYKIKVDDDLFFSQYDPTFKDLKPNTVKKVRKTKILDSNPIISKKYDLYKRQVDTKRTFYKNRNHKLQSAGDADLWKLLFELTMKIVNEGGCVSMLIPQQLLVSAGLKPMREKLLDSDIRQLYVFENKRQKFFPIDAEWRFILLTLRNQQGSDEFDVGFYLHSYDSLGGAEANKFFRMSKERIARTSPNDLVILETDDQGAILIEKLSKHAKLGSGLSDGWDVEISCGFHHAADAKLLIKNGKGWPVLEGKNTYQFDHSVAAPEFMTDRVAGLRRENKRQVYVKRADEFHNVCRLAFHDVAKSTTVRSIVANIIPPQTFHTAKLPVIVLKNNGRALFGSEYDQKNLYLLGILNSMTFDFIARPRLRLDATPIIKNMPIPRGIYEKEIAKLAARLTVGHSCFDELALSMGIKNVVLSPKEKIHALAQMDAFVAYAYGLERHEYELILNTFKFGDDNSLLKAKKMDLTNRNVRKNYYGEVRKLAMHYFDRLGE